MKYRIGKIDLSQIECRLLNTVAGQWDVVESFRAGRDVYSEQATVVYGFTVNKKDHPEERQVGKILELQAGYGSGEDTIRRTLKNSGCRIDDRISYRDGYRGKHPAVVRLWKTGERMLTHLRDGVDMQWPDCDAVCVADHRLWHIPSGLWMDFTSLEWHMAEDGEQFWRMRVKNGYRKVYGAKLIENLIQFLARLVISDAMLRVIAEGYKIPLTVHDDLIILIPKSGRGDPIEQLARLKQLVAQQLLWLPECPITAEATLGDDIG
jgi:DNA polymerase